MNAGPNIGKAGGLNPLGPVPDATVYGVVVMERVTVWDVAPGVIVADGENEAAAPVGSGVTALKTTGSENAPFEGDNVKGKVAVPPDVTGGVELGGITE